MIIKENKLNDELVMEIGKFSILWNCFERFQCDNLCNPKRIKSVYSLLSIDKEKQAKLAKVLNKRRSWFGQVIPEYVETGLYPGNARQNQEEDRRLMEKFMEQREDDLRCGCLKEAGIGAVTYMPTRNTPAQLERLRRLCEEYGMFQISGEDINSPRQSFVIKAMEDPKFANLIDATWKLIEHEKECENRLPGTPDRRLNYLFTSSLRRSWQDRPRWSRGSGGLG